MKKTRHPGALPCRRSAAGCSLALAAAELTGPDPALAPGADQRGVDASIPSKVHRDPDCTPYVFKGPNEMPYLSGCNVTRIDRIHVVAPPGIGGFDRRSVPEAPLHARQAGPSGTERPTPLDREPLESGAPRAAGVRFSVAGRCHFMVKDTDARCGQRR